MEKGCGGENEYGDARIRKKGVGRQCGDGSAIEAESAELSVVGARVTWCE